MDSSPSASAVDRPSSGSLRQPWLMVQAAIWFNFLRAAVTVTILVVPAIFSAQRNPSDHAIQMGLDQLGLSADVYAAFFVILQLVYAITFIVTAVIIFWRKSDNGLAIFVAVFLVCFGATPSQQFADLARAQPVLGVMVATLAYVGWSCLFPFFYVFPDGHFVPRWTRIATVIAFVQSALWGLPSDSPFHPNHWPPILLAPVLMSLLASVLYAQIYRYRNVSTALQRQQTKWIIFAFAIAAILRLINLVPGFLVPSSAPPIAQVFSEMFYAVASFAFIFIPLVLAVSIFRYRLWDIDFLINRTMVYGRLTACLALIFGVIVSDLSLVIQRQ